MTEQYRASFDAAVAFSNGGGLLSRELWERVQPLLSGAP
jgi:hypothetical protein